MCSSQDPKIVIIVTKYLLTLMQKRMTSSLGSCMDSSAERKMQMAQMRSIAPQFHTMMTHAKRFLD